MSAPQSFVNVSRRPPDIEDYIDMLRRYRSWIIGPMFAGLVLSVVVAFMWPDTYISTAVMRITPQQVSERLVPAMMNNQMAERLQQMEQEILSRTSLSEIIQKPSLNLYKKERARLPLEDIIQDMKNKAIKIQMLDVPGAGGGRMASAFVITFSYTDRYMAQAVVRELVTKFTEQNVTVQRNQTSLTKTFLDDETKGARDKMDALESQVTKFKQENQGRLPEQLQANIQMVNSIQMQLLAVNEAMNRDQQDKLMLETTLSTLRNQQNFYMSNMEDTIQGQSAKNERLASLNQQITAQRMNLAAFRQSYGDKYPSLRSIEASISVLEKERDDAQKQELEAQANSAATPPTRVINPNVAKSLEDLKGQQASTQVAIQVKQADIEERMKSRDELNRQLALYQARIESSPQNEQQYAALMRDYGMARQTFEEMKKRGDTAQTAANIEEHKAGENLELLDAASLPEQPAEPNRLAIAGIGTAMGLVAGIVLAGAKEVKNTSLKNLKDVRAYTNLPVLSSIPLLENALLVRRKRRLFWLAWSSAVIIGSIAMSGSMYYYYFGHQ
jgi:succinoglycan biosynthesis transport protein ExoP